MQAIVYPHLANWSNTLASTSQIAKRYSVHSPSTPNILAVVAFGFAGVPSCVLFVVVSAGGLEAVSFERVVDGEPEATVFVLVPLEPRGILVLVVLPEYRMRGSIILIGIL